jgi:YD repeat-containing protein
MCRVAHFSYDVNGHRTEYVYDDAGRRTQVIDALGHVTEFTYDNAGRQTEVKDARGNKYLRRLFVHGARAVLLRVKHDTGQLGQWVHRLEARTARNKVIVAVANKLARIVWAVLFREQTYWFEDARAEA